MTQRIDRPHFLLVGNSPYTNRGNEAIVRGTMAVLENAWGSDFRVTLGTIGTPELVQQQADLETDSRIRHILLRPAPIQRWSSSWWRRQLWRTVGKGICDTRVLASAARTACCALEVGGDLYSLEYGKPLDFMHMDRFLESRGIPVVLWGASIGPFDSQPRFAAQMFRHLRRLNAIFAREQQSYQYLWRHGVRDNLHQVADPAFAMRPEQPDPHKVGSPLSGDAVGINFSPLMARYATRGDMDEWVRRCAAMVTAVAEGTRREIVLIPHVTAAHSDDAALLRRVAGAASTQHGGGVTCLSGRLSAAETKWVIGRCSAFVGARTHATIAALSSGVPTISLAYSAKAKGLNADLFGSQEFCLQPEELTPAGLADRVLRLLRDSAGIREHLRGVAPGMRDRALLAGTLLRSVVDAHRVATCQRCVA